MSPSGQKVSNMLLGKNGGQLLIAPEKMKQLGQSRNYVQMWMCLVVKVKSDVVKNTIFIRTRNIKYMNQGTLEMVKEEEMARLNMDILGISELKWTGMGEFNSYDHYIYYCGQESLIAEATEYTHTQCSYMMIVWTEIFLLPFVITFMLFWIALSHWSIFVDTIKHYDNNLKCQLYAKDVKIP